MSMQYCKLCEFFQNMLDLIPIGIGTGYWYFQNSIRAVPIHPMSCLSYLILIKKYMYGSGKKKCMIAESYNPRVPYQYINILHK